MVMKMKKTRIVFMGTADFSKAVLEMLIAENYNIVGVVSQPDRPVGRKHILKPTLVKEVALEHQLPCIQPEKIKTDYQAILDLNPDLIITAAYGQIVPKAILEAPRLGCINVHASLLPKLRGGAPVHHAIIDGYQETGVTIMYMASKMDAGDMLANVKTAISQDDDVGVLYERLTILGKDLLKDILPMFIEGKLTAVKQDEAEVTYAPTITREEEHIYFDKTVDEVERHIRGLTPWPSAYAVYQGENIKIWKGYGIKDYVYAKPGTIMQIDKTGIYVACQDGLYCIEELQVPGKKRMSIKDYLNGRNQFMLNAYFE